MVLENNILLGKKISRYKGYKEPNDLSYIRKMVEIRTQHELETADVEFPRWRFNDLVETIVERLVKEYET
jgi:hypothetical protein